MRQTSGAMICPSCGKLISVNEERCPFCGAWRPGMFGYGPVIKRMFGTFDFPHLIVVACVALYVIALLLDPASLLHPAGIFSILAPSNLALYETGMTGGPAWSNGWWWTLFTAIFLHGGLLHIFFNMMWVRDLGPAVMRLFGSARGFVIFMVAGAAGFLVSNVVSGHPSVGASGSIFGLLAALIVYGRRGGGVVMTQQLWQWAIILFVMGFFFPGVNNWAHAGGFAGGWLTAQVMPASHERRESIGVQLLALAFVAVTLVGFVLSFVRVRAELGG
jgi:rhomboid protease GluP